MERKGYNLIHVIIIILVTSIISAITIGIILSKSQPQANVTCDELAQDDNVQEFLDIYSQVVGGYYEDVDKDKVIQSAINGMMDYLDESYTTYLDGEEASSLMEQLNGKYEGIGITIKDHKVLNTIVDSPAEEAGLISGDLIKDVNGIDVTEKSNEEIVLLIKEHRENVILGIERKGVYQTFSMKVKELKVPSVNYNIIDNTKIGYIQMTVFSEGTAIELKNAISNIKEKGVERIILDLRNNTGGYLEEALESAELFLEKGKMVYSLKNKNETEHVSDNTNEYENVSIVVLVNKGTASAAEILTAALKDSYGATIVGVTTYGKGKVQHTYSLQSGDIVKYTSSKWLRPNGVCIDGVGIKPDFEIENEIIYDESDPDNILVLDIIDHQMNKAIELLSV